MILKRNQTVKTPLGRVARVLAFDEDVVHLKYVDKVYTEREIKRDMADQVCLSINLINPID